MHHELRESLSIDLEADTADRWRPRACAIYLTERKWFQMRAAVVVPGHGVVAVLSIAGYGMPSQRQFYLTKLELGASCERHSDNNETIGANGDQADSAGSDSIIGASSCL